MFQKLLLIAVISFTPFTAASAQQEGGNTYTLQRTVTGFGPTQAKAKEAAEAELNILMSNLNLPPGHQVSAVLRTNEFFDPPNAYVIEVTIVVWNGEGTPPPGIGKGPVGVSLIH